MPKIVMPWEKESALVQHDFLLKLDKVQVSKIRYLIGMDRCSSMQELILAAVDQKIGLELAAIGQG